MSKSITKLELDKRLKRLAEMEVLLRQRIERFNAKQKSATDHIHMDIKLYYGNP